MKKLLLIASVFFLSISCESDDLKCNCQTMIRRSSTDPNTILEVRNNVKYNCKEFYVMNNQLWECID